MLEIELGRGKVVVANWTGIPDDEIALPAEVDLHDTQYDTWTCGDDSVTKVDLPNELRLWVWQAGQTGASVEGPNITIEDYLTEWDHPGLELAEWLALWDCHALKFEKVADETWDGPCRIWEMFDRDETQSCFIRDEDGDLLEFKTFAEATAYVDAAYAEYQWCNPLIVLQA